MSENLDSETINNIKELMGNSFPMIVKEYLQSADGYIEGIKEGILDGNCRQITDAAHPLKSSSGALGVFSLSDIAEKIESIADNPDQNGQDMSQIEPLLDELQSAYVIAKEKLLAEISD